MIDILYMRSFQFEYFCLSEKVDTVVKITIISLLAVSEIYHFNALIMIDLYVCMHVCMYVFSVHFIGKRNLKAIIVHYQLLPPDNLKCVTKRHLTLGQRLQMKVCMHLFLWY